MFPLGKIKPNCKESWVVTSVDKTVAIYEFLRYKLKENFSLILIFVINFMFE